MKESYTLFEVAKMTGLTDRTLRSYIKQGFLNGEKEDGVWRFSLEELGTFFAHPNVRPSIQAKRNAIVYDFLLDQKKGENEICMILDFPADEVQAEEISEFFCREVNRLENVRFSFGYSGGNARVILKGNEAVLEIAGRYYSTK